MRVIWTLMLAAVLTPRPAGAVLDIEDRGPVLEAGGFRMRITNAGIIGNAFLDKGLSFDPSFELNPGSGSEALNYAALWVGARNEAGETWVSGGPLLEWRPTLDPEDHVRDVRHGTPGTRRFVDDDRDGRVDEETLDGRDEDADGEVDEDLGLFAQQMASADYVDDRPEAVFSTYENGETHHPLGLSVHQEAYAFSTPGFEGTAALQFHITNHGIQTLRDVRIGLLADLDSRLRSDRAGHLDDRVEQRSFSRVIVDGISTVCVNGSCGSSPCTRDLGRTLPVLHDRDPNLPWVAVLPLDHTTDPFAWVGPLVPYARAPAQVSFRTSVYSRGRTPGQGGLPIVDAERYRALSGTYPQITPERPEDYVVLVSCGPFSTLSPGQSLDFAVALVAAPTLDSLQIRLGGAAQVQNGFLENRIPDVIAPVFPFDYFNGISGLTGHEVCIEPPAGVSFILDPHCAEKFPPDAGAREFPTLYTHGQCIWTDADCNLCTGLEGKETRIRWLDPGTLPAAPHMRVERGDHRLRILWDNYAEVLFKAGLTGMPSMRFAGYRVYKLADWRGRTSELSRREKWSLWNAFGDEGRDGRLPLDSIRDTTLDYQLILYEQKLYEPGRYAVVDTEALNGFEYAYAVTAVFEQERDVGNGVLIESTESPFIPSANQMIQPHAASRDQAGEVWVVPNPFRARADWDLPPILGQQLTRHLDFMGLPRAPSTIRIYTLAGDHVATIQHDGSYGDGQASWNLVSRNGQEVVSGIYVFTVDSTLGHQVGRFVVIR